MKILLSTSFLKINPKDDIRTILIGIAHNFTNWMIKYIYYEHAVTNSTCTPGFALAQTIITCTRIKISTLPMIVHGLCGYCIQMYPPLGFTCYWWCVTIRAVMGFCYWFLTLQSCFVFFNFVIFNCCILNLLLNCML